MINNVLKTVTLVFLPFLSSCCNTTGDPNAGGLFCWSQKKAEANIKVQRERGDELKGQIIKEQEESKKLKEREQVLIKEIERLEEALRNASSQSEANELQELLIKKRKELTPSGM